jgi:hypothetical protein
VTFVLLQVWYSSAWSQVTKAAFLAAVSSLLDESNSSSSTITGADRKVMCILRHWSSHHDVSLATSRAGWLDSVSKTLALNADIGGCKRQVGRLAYSRYIFTGAARTALPHYSKLISFRLLPCFPCSM